MTDRKWNPVLAEREFRALADRSFPKASDPKRPLRHQLQNAFRAKQAVETGAQWSLRDNERHLVETLQWRLGRESFESLYDEWLLIGDRLIYESIPPDQSELKRPPAFEILFVDADYSFLSG